MSAIPPEPPIGTWVKDRHGGTAKRFQYEGWIGWAPPGCYPFGKWEAMWESKGPLVECGPWGEPLPTGKEEMTAADMVGELETMMGRLDTMSEDDFFTARQKTMLEDAARRVDVVFQEAMDNVPDTPPKKKATTPTPEPSLNEYRTKIDTPREISEFLQAIYAVGAVEQINETTIQFNIEAKDEYELAEIVHELRNNLNVMVTDHIEIPRPTLVQNG